MKEINLPSGNYIFVEVPNDALNFKIIKLGIQGNYIWYQFGSRNTDFRCDNIDKIISTTNDITEEQCKNLIDDCDIYAKCWKKYTYKGAKDIAGQFNSDYSCWTPKESLQSLIQSVEMDLKQNYLILKKI